MRFVTVNMFETVFDEVTWDIHGSRPFTDVQQMAKEVAPNFDSAYTAAPRGPRRARAPRDHDGDRSGRVRAHAEDQSGRRPRPPPGVWSILVGGGPIKGGQVVGESDELGYARTRPVTPGEVAATLYRGLGIDPHKELPGPQNRPLPLVDYNLKPIAELF